MINTNEATNTANLITRVLAARAALAAADDAAFAARMALHDADVALLDLDPESYEIAAREVELAGKALAERMTYIAPAHSAQGEACGQCGAPAWHIDGGLAFCRTHDQATHA